MILFNKKKKAECEEVVRENSPDVIKAREYLEKIYPTLIGRDSPLAGICGKDQFNYVGYSKNGEYTRFHFCEGHDDRIIYVVLSNEEREKMIQLFNERAAEYDDEFTYKDSLKGMFVGEEVKHRFFSSRYKIFAFMSDDGDIQFPTIIHGENMD